MFHGAGEDAAARPPQNTSEAAQMYLTHVPSGNLVEIVDQVSLFDPCRERVTGRLHAGEEMQEPEQFAKSELRFPSGEPLPRCWLDPGYRS